MTVTVAELWRWVAGREVGDEVLDWAPDVAALTAVLLERTHAFRFVVSPPPGAQWPPAGDPYAQRVAAAAGAWRRAMDIGGEAPDVVQDCWRTVQSQLGTPLRDLSQGRPWEVCRAILLLHAIADETWAGAVREPGSTFAARARELLARTGSLSRLPVERVAHLPKARTTGVGITHRSLSRYTCTTADGIGVRWDRVPVRRVDGPIRRHANILLLPWPLQIRESDFVPVPGSVRRPERDPFGFFSYEPSEALDLGLLDGLLRAARQETDGVDVVVLPEGCVAEAEIPALEALLATHGVPMLVAGVRPAPPDGEGAPGGPLPANVVHTGVLLAGSWYHYRQHKHHRWFLDGPQIETYNIAGALHPGVRWWEAMDIPHREVHLLDVGAGISVAAVICEDLARLDGVAQLLRGLAPTLVVTLLLDGPQLASRWTARYAGVLADDPGSAVLTLTALGMAMRSRPGGIPPSRVIAMWKDPVRGVREIPLEPGAQGVLLTAVLDRTTRYVADGRRPADDATDLFVAGVHQLRADSARVDDAAAARSGILTGTDLSVLSVWAQALAAAVPAGRPAVAGVLASAEPGAPWRASFGLPPPSASLCSGLSALTALAGSLLESGREAVERAAPTDEIGVAARAALIAALD